MINLKFDKNGLIPVIAQDYRTGEVRMLAWANEEAVKKTLETGYAHYYSRSRGSIWKKGETSGELQRVVEVRVDCDEDALIYMVYQEKNTACHKGERNCFFRDIWGERANKVLPFEVLQRLQDVIKSRIEEKKEGSYTYSLFSQGEDRVLQKFGEEAVESLIALKNGDPESIKAELSDMLYHMLLALTIRGVDISQVLEELSSRFK
ncbi:MAG: bifunctional phosphoribosyl-AMP cyclohydrolase/phosphoribosyl-ATP diphosphatase HisIE [Hydrogenobacter thermophilus]|uniref:bifunctional phosphoribosyl-AMP cyclohydrolase/phosphoribosyl-ATP diphosphatase HisIE n=1 Tax=Hydrogenobacter thermophilus TaxID=940 RepID=UPI001C77D620|nr:bifunctional phosphoribosyl-AMP cyclohydrolase/phosphoribosyl-ATP diphosphatase HisIE [Hydrogenobacter thermophilus]QWK19581.1 MAG: bifunctional phosphoribosyl-AMP cyclohydrolase/phosphoribosyl-ATP diphosphatase HisIE [Hydrogenobacter thermophilus]